MTSPQQIRYDNRVVVVTGAGSGLGKAYALFFAERGAKVVVNDLGGAFNGGGQDGRVADAVVSEIQRAGGTAVASYDSVENGERIIATATQAFGRIDVLINNAGILRDVTLRNMKDEDWDKIIAVHLTGAWKTTRAAWPWFRKQRYGRVVNTSSTSGLYGNFGQGNYAAAKLALVGFTETLAKEGAKYNIRATALAPSSASRLTATVWPPEMMAAMDPAWVVPLVGVLVHESLPAHLSGGIFEAAAGHYDMLRWERSRGALLRPDENLTPDVLLRSWDKVVDFTDAEHPRGVAGAMGLLQRANQLPPNVPGTPIRFDGKVVLVTGGGDGLGRAYARLFGRLGAKVVVNDLARAEGVAKEIRDAGGEAIAVALSVERGDEVVAKVVETYGRIDIVVNNAGILRDKAFANMSDEQWTAVINVHLRGTYKVTKAAWPHMLRQKYGRIVNISSTSGIYGNFGQANYAAAKTGILGFSRTIAREGAKYNIHVNTVAPSAGTAMTRTVRPEAEVQQLKPEFVAPLIALLCSDVCPTPTGGMYEAGSGWFAATRWQRARGVDFPHDEGVPSVEAVKDALSHITDFDDGRADNPESPSDGGKWAVENILRSSKSVNIRREDRTNRKYLNKIAAAIGANGPPTRFTYTDKDVILYNLGLGASHTDLPLVYEKHPDFHPLPTFAVVPTYTSKAPYILADILPNFNPRLLLHGEQYLELKSWPIPTSGTLLTTTKLVEVVDKANAAVVRRAATTTTDEGKPLFYSESAAFIRGSGNFGGSRNASDRGPATAANKPPARAPDAVVSETTPTNLAAIYRLSGDRNPLHIDSAFSSVGGFKVPILHGLATFGIAAKHVSARYGPWRAIKVRFAGTVLPGETIVTEMWREDGRVIFQAKVQETGKVCLSAAAAELGLPGGGEKASL
ncbi:peroxisomal hydratase-dehydrogenase-epimerase [Trichodelitschia bisporula]|uniref:Peroxisomal hydratase-dehydrogenase-epimerase n=1 Tax=Trichodelitschia bisporula TaxID=703511 RepID=A0A6G1HSH2_9PEZI|nr:peroxisomal hydratase-dehydrogenase-epimerase [Trichodelitschia bisporula]